MKLGISLDGLLCDTESLRLEWEQHLGDSKFLLDAPFWSALKPYDDVLEFISSVSEFDIYVLAERSASLFLPTRAWLRNNCGLNLNKDRLICPSLKRFDCRIHEIDVLVDSDKATIENLKREAVHPVRGYLVRRDLGESLLDVLGVIRDGR